MRKMGYRHTEFYKFIFVQTTVHFSALKWFILICFVLICLNSISSSAGFNMLDYFLPRPVKCYDSVGCFSCHPPFGGVLFYRFLCHLPADTLKVKYALYTRPNVNETFYLHLGHGNLTSNEIVAASPIIPGAPLKVIIPGYLSQLTSGSSFEKIKDELLMYGNYNVIIVDWTSDNSYPYVQAFANARVVGAALALLLKAIQETKGIEYDEMHLIGHSLGAHIAGWAGERIKEGLGRITGLDPAGLYFQKAPNEVRLDKTDAKFVDIIHTSGGNNVFQGYGMHQPIGDVDFYPNGGKRQPNCGKATLFSYLSVGQCVHSISQDYFRASIRECKFQAVMCKNDKEFTSGSCNYNHSEVNDMGFHAKKIISSKTHHPKFYLFTTAKSPFCNVDNSPVLEDHNPPPDSIVFFFVNFLSIPISYTRIITDLMSYCLDASYTIFLNLFKQIYI